MNKASGIFSTEPNLNLAVIGNCGFSALIDRHGTIVWSCFPRFDGDPVFCSLLRRNRDLGFWSIELEKLNPEKTIQHYIPNTAILVTKLQDYAGNAIEITDFCPRFPLQMRLYRPNNIIRVVRPTKGMARIRIRLQPTFGYGWGTPERTRGSNHIRYILSTLTVRLTTNTPISYILNESVFNLDDTLYLILMPDESLTESPQEYATSALEKTKRSWREWVYSLNIPLEWQEQCIRAAITLKLASFEETGAIVASMTTSIPRSPTSPWGSDYRYCFLRDAGVVVRTLNKMGTIKTMEDYLRFISNVVASFAEQEGGWLHPVYGVGLEERLHYKIVHRLAGYRGIAPVTIGTKDFTRLQNDTYGSVILALTQVFFDRRFEIKGEQHLFDLLQRLGEMALQVYDKPDDRENEVAIHTFSATMCWAGCNRLAKIASKFHLKEKAEYWEAAAEKIRQYVYENCFNQELNSFVSVAKSNKVSAYLLLLPYNGFIKPNDPKFLGTLTQIEKKLLRGQFLLRLEDSNPNEGLQFSNTFWYIAALAETGRKEEARTLFENTLTKINSLGLLSECFDPITGEMWGNFPHTASLASLIECATRLSAPWESVI
jgi:GH15 family glucan-1,4-alpha-glucosidase